MPKLLLAACVPAIDWNTRSTGEPLRISSSVVVTCASTQLWVGMSSLIRMSSSIDSRRCARSGLSVAGLMPMTASPGAQQQAVEMLAAMPRASSVGWLGCSRTDRRPGRPTVLRNRVTTEHFAAITMRSCRRLILLTAAAISGVMPGASAARTGVVASSDSSQSRKPPTVRCATGAKAARSWLSMMRRVTSSAS